MIFPNERIKKFLESLLEHKESQIQSMLFWGEKGTGKMTTALNFANSLLCLNQKKWDGCGNCVSCQLLKRGLHPDLKIIDTTQDTISIDEIKGKEAENKEGLIQFLSFYPQISSFRVAIINEAEKLTLDAQNAFLKTLEEPPTHSIIILISSEIDKLLETVSSRLLTLRFNRLPKEKLKKYLIKEYSLEEKMAEKIASQSNGKIGLAVKLLDKEFIKKRNELWQEFSEMLNNNFIFRSLYLENKLKLIKKQQETQDKEGKDTSQIKEIISVWLENLEREITQKKELPLTQEEKIKLAKELLNAYNLISSSNINIQLLLENIFLTV